LVHSDCDSLPGPRQVLISPNRVFDASLVPKTCLDSFVDLKGLIKQVSGESRSRTLARPEIPLTENNLSAQPVDATPYNRLIGQHFSQGTDLSKLYSIQRPQ
jgi:hypothetical protein